MAYIEPIDVLKWLNAVTLVRGETLGIGNSNTSTYTLQNRYVIQNSVSIYYGDSYPNDITLLDSNNYSIDYDSGTITLNPTGQSLVDGKTIFADYSYAPIPNSTIADLISKNQDELERLTGRRWETTSITVYLDYNGEDYIQLPYYPIQTITSIQYNENELGTSPSWKNLEGNGLDKDWYIKTTPASHDKDMSLGKIWLTGKTEIPEGKARIKVDYTYGYSTIPDSVKRLLILMTIRDIMINPVLAGSLVGGYDALINIRTDAIDKQIEDTLRSLSQNRPRIV